MCLPGAVVALIVVSSFAVVPRETQPAIDGKTAAPLVIGGLAARQVP